MVIWAVTLWTLFACWLMSFVFGAPRPIRRTAGGLLIAELFAVGVWSYGSEGCTDRPCGVLAEVGRVAATQDIPAISVVLIAVSVARAYRGAATRNRPVRRRASRG